MATFSIVIPCYKVEKYIRDCLDSVLAQKIDSWEAICTDDGSPDGTGAILDEYAARDGRIKVIHQQNAGLSAARNAALEVATGEWLLYLDSDDVLSPWALETYVKMMEKFPQADILRAGMATSESGDWDWGAPDGDSVGLDVHDRVTKYGIAGYFQRMAYKHAVYGDLRFIGMSWCEERPYVAKCLARAKYVTDTPVVAYGFRVREGSITHTKMKLEHQMGYLDATKEMLQVFKASGKMVDAAVVRMLLTNWLEWQPRYILENLEPESRSFAWRNYFKSLSETSQHNPITAWRRFTIVICRAFPFVPVAMLLCYLPDWLKRKGVHR